ncbi:large conductance mechanosensitive channel [Nocardioides cavernae]|uniref:Large conductance mechanosensitive channel n=1 Tax=Nocardioides cavernae TaxID=1921566 RepID=A0A7Y9H0M6_9ACTN|nr:MscL family protein [Nocardioides cavernae]NYE35732.1 large conductance mechanosensitive channel [Nocardioides cavernae]
MTGFKNFILRGNLVELAVAVIIGTSFAAVVTAFTEMLLSFVAKITGGAQPNFDSYAPGDISVGPFLTAGIAFLILAAVVYFFVVTPYTKAKERFFPAEDKGTPADVALLEEIRDLLKTRGGAV